LSVKSHFSSSSSCDNNKDLSESHIDDHANDDELLIASNLKDINLTDTCFTNGNLILAGKPTMPIELYRLLRLSTLQPKLGFNKLIRWTNDGNGFHILDELRFTKEIVFKTSKMSSVSSFRTALGQHNFFCADNRVENGNTRGRVSRIYQHRSIVEAENAKDPSLRLFYRGVSLDVMRTIKTRKEIRVMRTTKTRKQIRHGKALQDMNGITTDGRCVKEKIGSGIIKNTRIKRKRSTETVWKDKGYSCDDNGQGNVNTNGRGGKHHLKPKIQMIETSLDRERERRRTSDGCLLPKYGAEQLLLEDGTYDKPRGAQPNGLFWDEIRGLWAPVHLLTKKQNEGQPPSKRRRTRSIGDRNDKAKKEQEHDDQKRSKKGLYCVHTMSERRTSDGCLLPKSEPFQFDDGTYKQPKGHEPKNMTWDKIRGLWVPKDKKKRKFGSNTSRSLMSSSEDDATIIKASKANLFHHSSSIFRTFFQPKNKQMKYRNSYHSKSYQARTKGNPSGIVNNTINLSNWQKIERLMNRSTQNTPMAVPVPSAVTKNTSEDEGEVRLI